MTTLNINLPEAVKAIIDLQVENGTYSTSGDYISALVRADQERNEKLEALRRDIQIGIQQADAGQMSDWNAEAFRAKAMELLRSRRTV